MKAVHPHYLLTTILVSLLSFFIFSCQEASTVQTGDTGEYPLVPDAKIKNVILFIGDGMGIAQVYGARVKYKGVQERWEMEKMPVTGWVETYSKDKLITDSAAGATAFATGYKTNNGMISVLPDGTRLKTILEAARQQGLKTGLVATSTITHATPASFASHVKSRASQDSIALQLLENRVNVLLGGGKKFFVPHSVDSTGRKDETDLLVKARGMGYQVVETRDDLLNSSGEYLLGLFAMGGLTTSPPEPMLAEMTARALDILKNDNGFFLMVEGSQIDWGSHDNDPEYALRQVKLFDEAIKVGLDFAKQDGQTLVIVTADHETGGLSVNGGDFDGENMTLGWTSRGHTAEPVPLFAFGPHALKFMGVQNNTDIAFKMDELLDLEGFPQ